MENINADKNKSIADELREYAWNIAPHYKLRELLAIADIIDEEREQAVGFRKRLEDAAANHEDVEIFGVDYAPLPLDADGVPIRVGERVQLNGNDPGTVSHMSLADDGWRVYLKYDGGIGTGSGEPKRIRHYHEPTVEGVLLDACRAYHRLLVESISDVAYDRPTLSQIIGEYAPKLRLADDSEEG